MSGGPLLEIRIPRHLRGLLREAVHARADRESVAFGLAGHARLPNREVLLVTKVVALPNEAYLPGKRHGAKWQGRAMLPVLNQALAGNLSVIIFHAHPHPGRVALSPDDRDSALKLLPVFQSVVPSRPHASIVFGDDCAAGMVLRPNGASPVERVRLRWLGRVIRDFDPEPPAAATGLDAIYATQALLTGGPGQLALRRAKIAVVGLSGGGSHVVQQLTHLGVGEIIGVDPDRVEASQRSRMVGLTALDVILRRRKTQVMARLVRTINRSVTFSGVPYAIPAQPAIDGVKASDVIVGCVDNYHARSDLQQLAWRYMIPYIDIGLVIRPLDGTNAIVIGGNVATFVPGSFCQWCIGFLSTEKLHAETGGRPRSYFSGADRQAQVISMNGLLASQGVTEVLRLLTGFVPDDDEMSVRKYDGIEGTLQKWSVNQKPGCQSCQLLGAGDHAWTTV